jgi:hypothetical protein
MAVTSILAAPPFGRCRGRPWQRQKLNPRPSHSVKYRRDVGRGDELIRLFVSPLVFGVRVGGYRLTALCGASQATHLISLPVEPSYPSWPTSRETHFAARR